MEIALALAGLVILLVSGDLLVRGAVNLALRLGLPALIVSLTVVSFGTSAPELLISVQAVLDHAPGIAIGNVVGSNIANVLLVLGIPALLSPLHSSGCDVRRNYLYMLGATLLFAALAVLGPIGWPQALILLTGLALFLGMTFRAARHHRRAGAAQDAAPEDDTAEVEGADPAMPGWRVALYLVLGLIGLPLGADILVESAVTIARDFGVSESVIGLTMVAVGTSMPELATTVMAALRRQADVALGNVIGSNIFNLLAIIGITGLVGTVPIPPEMLRLDIWVMLATALLLIPFVYLRQDIGRRWGAVLTALYVGYAMLLLS